MGNKQSYIQKHSRKDLHNKRSKPRGNNQLTKLRGCNWCTTAAGSSDTYPVSAFREVGRGYAAVETFLWINEYAATYEQVDVSSYIA